MSNSKLSAKEQEELNKLENEALEELYQIIAIAYQVQDIDYIDSMISAWKAKYKKILDNPSPDFKKKIEKLLNESYSKIVEYILGQIKLKEQKMIENQRKALNQLYRIIKDNYDLDTLKEKIKEWEDKYPYNSFLKMYQKRIDSAKREKNLEQYAFKQEEAFKDLYYGVVNRSGTIEELKEYLHKWEEKYSINDKFTIEQFIKHQSEIKRYTSDEFLISIAKKDDNILNDSEPKTYASSLDAQDSACKRLESIVKGKHNIYEVFKWVYENNSIEFNDYYKQRILNATYLNYSPKYLKTLEVPDIDLSEASLPIEQYNKMDEILRYAVISYFNLLLPPNQAISNKYFTEHMRTIYYQAEKTRHSNIINTFKDEVTYLVTDDRDKQDVELVGHTSSEVKKEDIETITTSDVENNILDIEKLISSEEGPHTIEIVTSSEIEEPITEFPSHSKPESKVPIKEEYTISEIQSISSSTQLLEDYKTETTGFIESDSNNKSEKSDIISDTVSVIETEFSQEAPIISDSTFDSDISTNLQKEHSLEYSEQNTDYTTIIAFSPSFFETINNYRIQADLIQSASKTAQKINTPSPIDKSNDKTRNQSD